MRIVALIAPLVSLAWGAPLALATIANNDNPAIWVLTAPFVLGAISYPGYAAAVLRPRNTPWIRASLLLGLTAAIGGLALAAWSYRHLADLHALGVAIAQSWPIAIATLVCPLIAIAACVIVSKRLSPRA